MERETTNRDVWDRFLILSLTQEVTPEDNNDVYVEDNTHDDIDLLAELGIDNTDQINTTEVIDSIAEEIFVPDTNKNRQGKAKRQTSKTPSSSSNKVENIPLVETRQTNRIRRPPTRFTS